MKKVLVGIVILFALALPFMTNAFAADLRVGDRVIVEGNAGTRQVEILIILSAPATASVTVNYTTQNGTATAGSDYQAANGTITFGRGEFSKKVAVNVVGDTGSEANETFDLVLSNPSGATIADGTGTVTVVNDDGSQSLPTYEIRATFTGHTGSLEGGNGCPVRNNGTAVVEGLVSGNEKVAADDDLEYEGTLWLSVDMDQCETDRKPSGDDFICGLTVIGNAIVKAKLAVYSDDRGGYIQNSGMPGSSLVRIFGTPDSPCTQTLISGEIPLFPDESIANALNGIEFKLPSGPLKVGRYVDGRMVLEVLRKIP